MADARGCVKTLSHHGRYGMAGTTSWLVLHCCYDADNLANFRVPVNVLFVVDARMLKYLSMASLQRRSLGRDPTLAEVGTHNASVSEDRSVSCPPNFSTRVPVRCSCCMFGYVQSIGREDCGSSPLSNRFYCTEEQLDINICVGKKHSLTTCHSLDHMVALYS